MMHTKFPDVNHALFLWRDERDLLHASKTQRGRTLCGKDIVDMAYAGRVDMPTCIECVSTP